MRAVGTIGLVLVVAVGAAHVVGAQRDSVVTVRVVETAPRADGRMDATAWSGADSITDFRQRDPEEGAQASERTVVKVLRDQDALYVAVRAWDLDAGRIKATQLRRDADLSADDNVTILIDSFHDRRGGFVFQTNPNGARWDAQITNQGDDNPDWNGIWDVTTSRDSAGWTAVFRIPFRTLRFESGATFGFNVRRFIRRRNEEDLWRGWRRTEGLYQLLAEGELTGLDGVRRTRDIEIDPYVLGDAFQAPHDSVGNRIGGAGVAGKVGVDAKVAVSPTLTADLTVNTDFAQVEVDSQVINLTRFPTFFPEKREFFLESSGIFDFGFSQRALLFYSRRIGLTDSGAVVPMLAGARLSGKAGPWSVGVLDARTGGIDDANDAVVRIKHDLLDRSYVGALVTERTGSSVHGSDVAAGVDADFPLLIGSQNIEPELWVAATQTPDTAGTRVAWRLGTDFPNDLFDNNVALAVRLRVRADLRVHPPDRRMGNVRTHRLHAAPARARHPPVRFPAPVVGHLCEPQWVPDESARLAERGHRVAPGRRDARRRRSVPSNGPAHDGRADGHVHRFSRRDDSGGALLVDAGWGGGADLARPTHQRVRIGVHGWLL